MSEDRNSWLNREGITRRAFLQSSVGAGLIVLAAGGAGAALLSCKPAAPPMPDMTVTSSLDFNHTHNVIIPGADITNAPSSKTYTSDGATHQHAITLTQAQFDQIRDGQTVTVTSTQTGATPHSHTFTIKRP